MAAMIWAMCEADGSFMTATSFSTASTPWERASRRASASILRLSGPWAGRPPGLPQTPFGKGRPLGLAMGLPVVILLKLALPLLRYQQTELRSQ